MDQSNVEQTSDQSGGFGVNAPSVVDSWLPSFFDGVKRSGTLPDKSITYHLSL